MVDLERRITVGSSGPTEADAGGWPRTLDVTGAPQWMCEDPQPVELLEPVPEERPGLVRMQCRGDDRPVAPVADPIETGAEPGVGRSRGLRRERQVRDGVIGVPGTDSEAVPAHDQRLSGVHGAMHDEVTVPTAPKESVRDTT